MALLGSSSEGGQWAAAGALCNLAHENAVNQQAIAAAGAIPQLVALLGSSNIVRVEAAKALRNLACNHPANKQAIAAAGAIPLLVAALGGGSTKLEGAAAAALRNLARNNAANQEAIAAHMAAACATVG